MCKDLKRPLQKSMCVHCKFLCWNSSILPVLRVWKDNFQNHFSAQELHIGIPGNGMLLLEGTK